MDNPYQPPSAKLRCESEKPGSIPKSIAVGVLIDLGGTWLVNFVGLVAHVVYLDSQGFSEDEVDRNHYFMTIYSGAGLILPVTRLFMSILAGYFCAAIAKKKIILATIMISLVSALIGFSVLKINSHYYSSIEHLWLTAICFPALCLGAFLYADGQ